MKKLFLLILLLGSLHTYAIQVKGYIIDAESKRPLEGVNIVLFQTDSLPISQIITKKDGSFTLQTPTSGKFHLTISYVGYQSSTIALENIQEKVDLGYIELSVSTYQLDEVTVSAQDYTKIDRQIIFPSAQLIAHSFNGLDVLGKLALPGVMVNTVTHSISLMSNRGVQVRINDVVATIHDLLAINAQQIFKIEYIDMPGLRYGDVEAVINVVLKKSEKGFSTGGSTRTAVSTYYTDNSIYMKYNNRLSEFGVNYQNTYSDYQNCFKDEQQTLQFPENRLQLTKEGMKAPNKTIRHNVALSYNWNNIENTIFNVVLRNSMDRPSVSTNQSIHDEINRMTYSSFLKTKDKSYTPTLDMYFQHSLDEKQTIIANALTSYISSDYNRAYYELWEDHQSKSDYSYTTDGQKYALVSEVMYENKWKKNLTFLSGIKYSQSYLENSYVQHDNKTINSMRTSEIQGYVQLQGSFQKFGYQLGAGYSRQYFNENVGKYAYYLFRPTVSLSYSLQDHMTLRYNFYLLPALPTLTFLSDFKQWQNEYEVFVGNPHLKPFHSYANTLTFNYRKGRLSLYPSLYYQYNRKPIMSTIDRHEEDGKYYFIYSNDNQKSYQHLQGRLYVTLEIIKNRLSITGFGVVNRYFNFGHTYTHCYTDKFGGLQLEGNYKNWSLSASMMLKSRMLAGETLLIYSPTANAGIRYKYKQIQLGAEVMNPFMPEGNPGKQEIQSKYVQKKTATYVKDQGNMFRFTFAWNLNFGRKYDTKQKRITNFDTNDAGIIK